MDFHHRNMLLEMSTLINFCTKDRIATPYSGEWTRPLRSLVGRGRTMNSIRCRRVQEQVSYIDTATPLSAYNLRLDQLMSHHENCTARG